MATQKEEVVMEWIGVVGFLVVAQTIIQMAGFLTTGQRNALRDMIKSSVQTRQDTVQTALTEDIDDRTSFDFD